MTFDPRLRSHNFMSRWRIFRFLRPSENTLLLALSFAVGLTTAFSIWGFREAIEFFHAFFIDFLANDLLSFTGVIGPIIALALAGLAIGWIHHRYVGKERYHGVAGIIEAVALTGGRLRVATMPFKALASAMSLGAGASVGPEDPSVQIGSTFGSFLGQRLHLKEDLTRLLVSAGAASAISAAFNAPIAGVFFALEVILHGELSQASVSVVIISAVVATGVTQGLGIGEATMGPFDFTLESALEIPFYLPLGILIAPIAAAFIWGAYWQYDFWTERISNLSRPIKTALAGALIGIVGIFLPEIMGASREPMNAILRGDDSFLLGTLVVLAIAKLVMTTVSLGAGFVGGIFAPSLFIGTMLGDAYGQIITGVIPMAGDPRAFAVAGMAGMMAGVVRAPITAIMLVFELTNDYRFILPIMVVTVICIFIAERIQKHSVYELGLVREGIHIQQGRDIDVMQGITVGEAMFSPAPTINEKASLLDLRDGFREYHRHALCVVDNDNKLVGVVTLSDLQEAFAHKDYEHLTVGEICTRDVLIATPEEVLWQAIRDMGARDVGRLPVVDSSTGELVGLVNRHDIVDAYNTAIHRKMHDQQRKEQIRLNRLTGAHVYELHVKSNAEIANKLIMEVQWPPEAVVASIQRKGKLIVPHGNTKIYAGDILMIVADPHSELSLMQLFGGQRAFT